MKRTIKYVIFLVVLVVFLIGSYLILGRKSSMKDWIYCRIAETMNDVDEEGRWLSRGLYRIHKKTGERELVWDRNGAYLVVGEKVYTMDWFSGIYQMDPDGSNVEQIYEEKKFITSIGLCYEEDWLYFSTLEGYYRLHVRTREIEEVLEGIPFRTLKGHTYPIVGKGYFYTTMLTDGTYKVFSKCLKSGEVRECQELSTGRPNPKEELNQDYYLIKCGDYLVLCYQENAKKMAMYATKIGGFVTEETVWEEVRFPDMKKGSAEAPHWDTLAYYGNYAFWEGYVFYHNEDWKLCSRPLLGEAEDVTVYEGTTLVRDQEGRYFSLATDLGFGEEGFYYRHYTEIDEEDAAKEEHRGIGNYEPIPTKWDGYIGELPKRKK